jgi:hypothetical protein
MATILPVLIIKVHKASSLDQWRAYALIAYNTAAVKEHRMGMNDR